MIIWKRSSRTPHHLLLIRAARPLMTVTNQSLSSICWISKSRSQNLVLCSLRKIITRKSTISVFQETLSSTKEEKNLPGEVVYDEYESDPGESQEEEEKEPEEQLSAHFFSYPEPVNEQPPPEISDPTTVVHSPVLVRDIHPHENNCVAEEAACRQFSGIFHSFYDPVSEYMEWHFPYALEPPYFISTSACEGEVEECNRSAVTVTPSAGDHRQKEGASIRKLLEWLWWKSSFT
jgi:hypothetical protein